MFMVVVTIVTGVYKPTYNWGAPPCSFLSGSLHGTGEVLRRMCSCMLGQMGVKVGCNMWLETADIYVSVGVLTRVISTISQGRKFKIFGPKVLSTRTILFQDPSPWSKQSCWRHFPENGCFSSQNLRWIWLVLFTQGMRQWSIYHNHEIH